MEEQKTLTPVKAIRAKKSEPETPRDDRRATRENAG